MTEEKLRVELECYKEHVNPMCDLDNMSTEELRDFYSYYKDSELYFKSINPDSEDLS